MVDLVNIGLGFLEGLALIISPCILPILPIILSGSLAGNKKRPYGIILGFILIFALFTFFSRKLVQWSGVDLNTVRHISYVLLFLFGLVMLSTYLTEKFAYFTRRLSNVGTTFSRANDAQGGWLSGIFFGGLIAIIWTPCAGPILAAVIVQTVIQQTTFASFLTILAFGIGAAVPMLVIALFGRELMLKLKFFQQHATALRKLLGAIIILSVIYMLFSEGLSTSFANSAPLAAESDGLTLQNGIAPYSAPEISGIEAWINSPPLTLSSLRGKVVLIDFWTYSCINCIRTLPHLKEWYRKYENNGLVIIGVHSPEFDFEKNLTNVKNAVTKQGILYPVALDNNFVTWQNYQNRFWPAQYLIDKNGKVVYQHFGEGDEAVIENNIRYLLGLKSAALADEPSARRSYIQTPETYLGYARARRFSSPEDLGAGTTTFSFPAKLSTDAWALQGAWTVTADKIIAQQAGSAIKIRFNAQHVFMVMGNATGFPVKAKILLNGEQVVADQGKDVVNSSITVNKHTLYEVLDLPQEDSGILQIIAESPGLEVYTFTFG